MKKISVIILLWCISGTAIALNCDLVYDEFDNLMNKEFLLHPEKYVKVKSNKLSLNSFNKLQKNRFLLSARHRGLGIAIVHTNKNAWGKLLYSWGKQNGHLSLVIREVVLYGRVKDGHRPRIRRNLNIRSSFTLDLDSGKSSGKKDDIWFHNVNGREMYIEAINGATLKFPISSLCQAKVPTLSAAMPLVAKPFQLVQTGTASSAAASNNEKRIVKRQLLANGHVLISYSDGSKLERYKGGFIRIAADGTRTSASFNTAAPVAIPVAPPGSDENAWLESHRKGLLNIIESLVDDPALIQQFVANVDNSGNVYQSIATRKETIQRLVLP